MGNLWSRAPVSTLSQSPAGQRGEKIVSLLTLFRDRAFGNQEREETDTARGLRI